ncbi:MAG: high-potential iron-sulfur protein [Bdellovibrionales bacterium]|nr:high-potential iron-sulfur protein [Bdellovibrionales bacterium]
MSELNRRNFFKVAASALGLAVVSGSLTSVFAQGRKKKEAPSAAASGKPSMVEPGKGMAANVNYQEDHKNVKDNSLKVDKQGVKWADQHCANCVLYTKSGDGTGKCTLFPGQLVKDTGWCTSWSKKA